MRQPTLLWSARDSLRHPGGHNGRHCDQLPRPPSACPAARRCVLTLAAAPPPWALSYPRSESSSRRTSDKRNANGAERAIVRMNHITLGNVDRTGERTGEYNLAFLQPRADVMEFVDEPGYACCRVAHYRRRNARLLDNAVLRQSGADPADIDVHWADRPAADDDRAEGGVIGDRVGDRARDLGSVVDDFESRHDIFGRPHHIKDALARPFEVFGHDKSQFDLK